MTTSQIQKRRFSLIALGSALTLTAVWLLHPVIFPDSHPVTSAPEKKPLNTLNTELVLPPPPAAVAAADPIRAEIRSAIDPTSPPHQRTELIQALPENLTETEYRALLHEIITLPAPGTAEAWHSSYVHEICKVLQRIPASHDLFASALATVAANRSFTVVYRDYAYQHLRILWQRSLDPLAPGISQPRNLAIEKTFRTLLTERPETAAQAILSLHELRYGDSTPAIPDQEINHLVDRIIASTEKSNASHIPARMTSVRIIAERNLPDNSETLRSIASSPQEHTLVRISAIGAIGHAAIPTDAAFLKSLVPDNPILAEALQYALKQF
jgi:hypothetical protein